MRGPRADVLVPLTAAAITLCVVLLLSWSNAQAAEEHGLSYGYAHTSDPLAGQPWNNDPELTTDMAGVGHYWKWKGTELHVWLGVKRNNLSFVGKAWSPAGQLFIMRKRPHRSKK